MATDANLMCEFQAGFTKGKSTIDQIFILQSLISKYLSKKKGRFYCVFVDFSKAFDTVPHLHLFYSMIRSGLHGRVITVLRNMYSKLKSCVQVNNETLSDLFQCDIGTRQGCMLSPFMFIFYLNELTSITDANNCRGIFVNNNYANVPMLLYADDLVLVGDQIGSVQKLLDALNEFCDKWGLKVNMGKTKQMVFRNGGIIKEVEKLYLNGIKLETSPYYKYLGILFSSRLSWSPAQSMLAAQAKKSLYCINKVNYQCNFSFSSSCDIFDKCTLPVLTYGSEVWGANVHPSLEKVHLLFCRRQLGVGSSAASPAVLGECGRYGIYINCYVKCVKYWIKLLSLPENCLLKACYDMLFIQCNAGRLNWASDIKLLLYRYGFGYIWEAQYVEDWDLFVKEFKVRLKDCDRQLWSSGIEEMSKLDVYRSFKTSFSVEIYLLLNIPRRLRSALARFRISNHDLECERGRYSKTIMEDRLCKLCGQQNKIFIETEFHVIFECEYYSDLRNVYIDKIYLDYKNLYSFTSLMQTVNKKCLINLCNFIYSMFKVRKVKLTAL